MSRRRSLLRWLPAAAALLLGCSAKLVDPCAGIAATAGTCVALYVDHSPAVDTLSIRISGSNWQRSATSQSTNGRSFSPPIAVALVLSDNLVSPSPATLQIDVVGLRAGDAQASGTTTATVYRDVRTTAHLSLTASALDLGVVDLGAVTDFAVDHDLAGHAVDGFVPLFTRVVSGSFAKMVTDGTLIAVVTADTQQTLAAYDNLGNLLATLDSGNPAIDFVGGGALYYRVLDKTVDAGTTSIGIYTLKNYPGSGAGSQVVTTNLPDWAQNENFASDGRAVLLENLNIGTSQGNVADVVLYDLYNGRHKLFTQVNLDNYAASFADHTNQLYLSVPDPASTQTAVSLDKVDRADGSNTPTLTLTDATNQFSLSDDGTVLAAVVVRGGNPQLMVGGTATGASPSPVPGYMPTQSVFFATNNHDAIFSTTGPVDGGSASTPILERYDATSGQETLLGRLDQFTNGYVVGQAVASFTTVYSADPAAAAYYDLWLLLAGHTQPVLFDTDGFIQDYTEDGYFVFLKVPNGVVASQYAEIGGPDGSKLGTMPTMGGACEIFDDDHVYYVDGEHVLHQYVISTQTTTTLLSHVVDFRLFKGLRRLYAVVSGSSADGVYEASFP